MASKTKKYFKIPEVQEIGIYAIRNKTNDKYYIGSSVNVYFRMLTHARNLIKFYGINAKMGEDIKGKRDFKNFEFIVLKTFENNSITDRELRREEENYIQKYNSRKNGYNLQWAYSNGKFEQNQKLCCKIVETAKKSETGNRNTKNKRVYDRFSILLPKGTKERIQRQGESINGYINKLVLNDLNRLEQDKQGSVNGDLPDFMKD